MPPRFVVLIGREGRVAYLTTEMRDIEERLELGILKVWSEGDPSQSGRTERFAGGRVLSFHYLAAPGFDLVSGVQITLDIGDLIVTSGDASYSIFTSLADVQRG